MKLLLFAVVIGNSVGSLFAGERVYNLPPWGHEDYRAIPWKYLPGDGVHEFVDGKLRFFVVTEVKWDNATNGWEYEQVPDFRMKHSDSIPGRNGNADCSKHSHGAASRTTQRR